MIRPIGGLLVLLLLALSVSAQVTRKTSAAGSTLYSASDPATCATGIIYVNTVTGDQFIHRDGDGPGVCFQNNATGGGGGDALVANPLSQFANTTSAQLAGIITNETGLGVLVFATSPALVTPDLGTPSAVTLTNGTGLPIATGVSGLGSGVATFLGTASSANLATAVTNETGSGLLVFGTSPVLTTPDLGTPSAITLTNGTGLPIAGITGMGTNVDTFLGNPTSANLAAAITNETGSSQVVFNVAPTLTGPIIGSFTVATLPSTATGKLAYVSDGSSSTDCTTGSGSTRVLCIYNGSAWTGIAGGGGGTSPGGSNTQVQINGSGLFVGDSGLTFNTSTDTLTTVAVVTSGSGAGYLQLAEGTVASPVADTIQLTAPAAITGSLQYIFPGTAASGIIAASNSSGVHTLIQRAITGTTDEISVSNGTGASGNPTIAISSILNLSSKTLRVPSSTSLPGTCVVGDSYMDTDATSGQRWYLCESTNTWVKQGDGGSGGGITNAASNNVIPKSDGTNLVASIITESGTTITVAGDVAAEFVSTGDGTVAGESRQYELEANGNNYVSWLMTDARTTTLQMKFPTADPTDGQVMVFSAPSSNIATITWANRPYDLFFNYEGVPPASSTFRAVAVTAFDLASSFTGTVCSAGTAATAQTDFLVKVNGTTKATLRFAAAGTTCSIVGGTTTSVTATDVVTVIAPASPDATLANVAITLKGVQP